MLSTRVWTTIAHLAFFSAAPPGPAPKKETASDFPRKSGAEFRTSAVGTAWQGTSLK